MHIIFFMFRYLLNLRLVERLHSIIFQCYILDMCVISFLEFKVLYGFRFPLLDKGDGIDENENCDGIAHQIRTQIDTAET